MEKAVAWCKLANCMEAKMLGDDFSPTEEMGLLRTVKAVGHPLSHGNGMQ